MLLRLPVQLAALKESKVGAAVTRFQAGRGSAADSTAACAALADRIYAKWSDAAAKQSAMSARRAAAAADATAKARSGASSDAVVTGAGGGSLKRKPSSGASALGGDDDNLVEVDVEGDAQLGAGSGDVSGASRGSDGSSARGASGECAADQLVHEVVVDVSRLSVASVACVLRCEVWDRFASGAWTTSTEAAVNRVILSYDNTNRRLESGKRTTIRKRCQQPSCSHGGRCERSLRSRCVTCARGSYGAA